jgi:hypothetical protein
MKISSRIILFCLAISLRSYSQQTTLQAGLFTFFDNAEFGGSSVQFPQTMAGVRFAPEASFKFDTANRIVVGINLLHEYGSDKAIGDLAPIAYYQYSGKPFRFMVGAFPRDFALNRYPRIFFRDSVAYYHPEMYGILWEYTGKRLFANIWLDWASRQSHEMREAFFVGFSGKYTPGIFYVQHFSYMHHFAGRMDPVIVEALHDNLLFLTSFGIDLSHKTIFDWLEINGGWIAGLDRARADNTGWIVNTAFLSEARIEYKRTGIFNTFFTGNGHMYFYETHNNELYWGDPFYRTYTYNRSDFYIDFIKNDVVNARFIYSLHFTERTMYNQQALKVSFNLNNIRLKN